MTVMADLSVVSVYTEYTEVEMNLQGFHLDQSAFSERRHV
jgi:hypothetical protein